MRTVESRLRKIQELAFNVMDDIHLDHSKRDEEDLKSAVDNLSRAVGMFSDPDQNVSLDYVEEKVIKAHERIVRSNRKARMIKVK